MTNVTPGCAWTFGGGLQEEWGRVGNCRLDLEYDEKNLMDHYGESIEDLNTAIKCSGSSKEDQGLNWDLNERAQMLQPGKPSHCIWFKS